MNRELPSLKIDFKPISWKAWYAMSAFWVGLAAVLFILVRR